MPRSAIFDAPGVLKHIIIPSHAHLILRTGVQIKSDGRILVGSDFVESVLSETAEKFERHYEIIRSGYNLDNVAERAAMVCEIETKEIFSKAKQTRKVKGRTRNFCLLCCKNIGQSCIMITSDR